jgi:hypothetical protein
MVFGVIMTPLLFVLPALVAQVPTAPASLESVQEQLAAIGAQEVLKRFEGSKKKHGPTAKKALKDLLGLLDGMRAG